MAETKEYVGTIETVELSKSGKSRRVNVKSDNGQNLWMSISIDKPPPPVGDRFKIKYAADTWNGKPTRWIENYVAMGPAPASRNGAQKGDSFPTVREQIIKEVMGNPNIDPRDSMALDNAVGNALATWLKYRVSAPEMPPEALDGVRTLEDRGDFEDEIPF